MVSRMVQVMAEMNWREAARVKKPMTLAQLIEIRMPQ